MPFKKSGNTRSSKHGQSVAWKIGFAAVAWLVIISALHYWLNIEPMDRKIVKMGYMPVITNLSAPLLDFATRESSGIRFDAIKFSSFADMGEALRSGQIKAAFIIAPLAVVLRQQGEDVKVVYIGNRHESTLVVREGLDVKRLSDLVGKTLAVPMRYSGHNISIMQMMEKKGLKGKINIVEMNPPDMAAALSSGSLDAYYVGEPFAAQTVKNNDAKVFWHVEDVWKHFICNLVIVRESFIASEPEVVRILVRGAARSGMWAQRHPEEAARIASLYWNQPLDLVEYALTEPENRIVYDRFVPKVEEMQHIADEMVRFGMIDDNDITGLVEDRFAKLSDVSNVDDFEDILGFR